MHTIAVIPARQGSRRVKDKNIKHLGGHPLIAWSIRAALKASSIDRVIVSTDSKEYATIARMYGAETPFIRPAGISNDCDTAIVVEHCIDYLESKEDYTTHYAVTLQPTSPFREPKEIDKACKLIKTRPYKFDSIISVTPIAEQPAWMFRTRGPKLESFLGIPPRILSGFIAQELPKLYIPNGSIYVSANDLLHEEPPRIYGDDLGYIVIPRERSIDIEEESDFIFAEALLKCQDKLLSILG